jgi:flagellar basal-body rod modification protein FlgD
MNEQDFMQLLMAQMQNQDPLQPDDSTAWVTQLATYSQVEQSVAQTSSLNTISTQLQGLSTTTNANLIGKTVTLQGGTFTWNGTSPSTSSVNLAAAAQQVNVTISDSSGHQVRVMTLGPQSPGSLPITWNGAEDSGQAAPSGTYTFAVSAQSATGQTVGVSQSVTGIVTQVAYANGASTLTLNNGTTASISQLASVNAAQPTQ